MERACQADAVLLAQVRRLLAEHEREESFILDSPPAGLKAALDQPLLSERPGAVIGHYKLLQQIGEGGMGVVFLAEQTEPLQRTVATPVGAKLKPRRIAIGKQSLFWKTSTVSSRPTNIASS